MVAAMEAQRVHEDFQEPDLELVARTERGAEQSLELGQALQVVADHERLIRRLAERIFTLQCSLAGALAQLKEREAELHQLRVHENTESAESPVPPPARTIRAVSVDVLPGTAAGALEAATITVELNHETHFFAGLMRDLAQGGLFVATYRRLAIGTPVEIWLTLSDGRRERIEGVVRWERAQHAADSERPGFGITFSAMSDATLSLLDELCREHAVLYMEL